MTPEPDVTRRERLIQWWNRIPLSDPLERRQASLIQAILAILFVGTLLTLPLPFRTTAQGALKLLKFSAVAIICSCAGAGILALRRGRFQLSVAVVSLGMILGLSVNMLTTGLRGAGPMLLAFSLPVALTGMLAGRRPLLLMWLLSVAPIATLAMLERKAPGLVGGTSTLDNPGNAIALFSICLGTLALFLNRFSAALRGALTESLGREEELKRAEAALDQQAQVLARSNADLERFAYAASHDLQEPLRMVTNYLQLLERRYRGKLDENATTFIGFAVDGAQRMQSMVNDILNYSRVGRSDQLAPVAVNVPVSQALANLSLAVQEQAAVIDVEQLPVVMGERSQLVQLFQNLLSNALKFRSQEPPRIHITAQREGAMWRFAIRDNGLGIDRQYSERIFVMFQRLHRREEYPGSGVGLALCKKIVEWHRGRIWVESEPGKGSTFYFTLLAQDAA